MRLLGKYTFETLRDALQGIFHFESDSVGYTMELWQLRIFIKPNEYAEFSVNMGDEKNYKKIGRITLE